MGLFSKTYTIDEILDDIASRVDASIVDKYSKLTSPEEDNIYPEHEQKLEILLNHLNKDEIYYGWYVEEIKQIKNNLKYRYRRTMILSATIAYFAFLDELTTKNKQMSLPSELAKLSTLQLLYEVYVRLLKKSDLGSLALAI